MKTYFIQLKDCSNNLILVNPNFITYIQPPNRGGSWVSFTGDSPIEVKETPTQIQGKIQ